MAVRRSFWNEHRKCVSVLFQSNLFVRLLPSPLVCNRHLARVSKISYRALIGRFWTKPTKVPRNSVVRFIINKIKYYIMSHVCATWSTCILINLVTLILDEALQLHVNVMRTSQLCDATNNYEMNPWHHLLICVSHFLSITIFGYILIKTNYNKLYLFF